jgi:PAS domain S-box-containing protein
VTFALVILVMAGSLALFLEGRVRELMLDQTEARADAIARSIVGSATKHLYAYDYISLQQIAEGAHLQDPGILRVVIHDKEGRVGGHSADRELIGRVPEDDWCVCAVGSEKMCLRETELEIQEGKSVQALEVGLPVLPEGADGARWGTVEVALSLEPLRREIFLMRALVTALAVIGVLLGTLAAHILSKRITRPIGELVSASRNLGEGCWESTWSLETGDEIGILAKAFRDAAQKLTQNQRQLLAAQEDLRLLNAGLEETVELRTRELQESRELYRLLVENAPDPFVLVQGDEILFANAAFEELFGSVEKEGKKLDRLSRIIHPDYRGQMGNIQEQAMETGEPMSGDVQGINTTGVPVELEVRGKRVMYRRKKALEIILVDVTQRRRLLRQLVQSERLRAMGEVTAMVAHNFNNILAVIVARVQFMMVKLKDATFKKSLKAIEEASHRGGEMVRKVQEYYGEQSDLQFTDVCVNAMVREVVDYVTNYWQVTRGEGGPIRVEMNLESTPFVWGAEPLLQDALKRVLLNAAEAMHNGGLIQVHTSAANEQVQISIRDEGVGMEGGVLRRAFDPFFSTKGSRLRGLGLTAALGIMQRHNGSIELKSEPERGTEVLAILPVSRTRQRLVGKRVDSSNDSPQTRVA